MKVIGLETLTRFSRKHANAKGAIESWLKVVDQSDWITPHDIKARYPSVDFLAGNRAIFNLKGNHFRLVAKIAYNNGSVFVEWIGTHAEYDKQTFNQN